MRNLVKNRYRLGHPRSPKESNLYGGSMYSRANASISERCHETKCTYGKYVGHPNLMGMGSPCGKVYSLAGVLYMRLLDCQHDVILRFVTMPTTDDNLNRHANPTYYEERAK